MNTKKSFLEVFTKTKHDTTEETTLAHARKKAEKIIENAVDKAEQIMSQTDIFTSDLKSEVKKTWQEYLTKTAKDLEKQSQELLKNVMEEFRGELLTDIQHSQAVLQQKRVFT
jgi:uncharacterized protein (DUF2267 family)